jgi:hypothetical protein
MRFEVFIHNPLSDTADTIIVEAATGDNAAATALAARDGEWRCEGVHPATVNGGNSDCGVRAPSAR